MNLLQLFKKTRKWNLEKFEIMRRFLFKTDGICHRCDKFNERESFEFHAHFKDKNPKEDYETDFEVETYLCADCIKSFKDWLGIKEEPEEEPKYDKNTGRKL